MPSDVFRSKRHDTGVSPELTLTPPPGLTWDLTEPGLTAKLIARLPDATAPKINAAVVVTGPWTVRYDPVAVDVDTIGAYEVEVEATRSNGKKITLPTERAGNPTWIIDPDLNDA